MESVSKQRIAELARGILGPAPAGARVALGMSGGVDSSATAALLLGAGYDVLGVTCIFESGKKAEAAVSDARAVASLLGVQHVVRDCSADFWRCVEEPFVDAYEHGLTPSPCVRCNAACKLPSLLAAANEAGCYFVATGHYARVVRRRGRFAVATAAHAAKDQSYMLGMLSQGQLGRMLVPLGPIAEGKARVREIARWLGLAVASKPESQDICFIEGPHTAFLEARGVHGDPGDIVTLDGRTVGRHAGLFRYTAGQRKGLGIGGAPEPYYVVGKRSERNELVVGFAHDALMSGVHVRGMNWQALSFEEALLEQERLGCLTCQVKLRYRQEAVPCRASLAADGGMDIALQAPASLTAPGQYAVLYDGGAILAAGEIDTVCLSK